MSIFSHPVASLIDSITSSVHQCNPPLSFAAPRLHIWLFKLHSCSMHQSSAKCGKSECEDGNGKVRLHFYSISYVWIFFSKFLSPEAIMYHKKHPNKVIWDDHRFRVSCWKPKTDGNTATRKGHGQLSRSASDCEVTHAAGPKHPSAANTNSSCVQTKHLREAGCAPENGTHLCRSNGSQVSGLMDAFALDQHLSKSSSWANTHSFAAIHHLYMQHIPSSHFRHVSWWVHGAKQA